MNRHTTVPGRRGLIAGAALALAGCAIAPSGSRDWHDLRIPGKTSTRYRWQDKEGRRAVLAEADRSASMWRKHQPMAADRIGGVSFSWWVDSLIAGADVSRAESEDAPAKVLFAFGGDVSKLPQRTRVMYELAQALTGEEPPYATLMYLWDNRAAVDSVIVNPRTDRIRKIVLDSGASQLGRWRDHQRSLASDFRRAFGEDPGPLLSVAVMTDSDNTQSSARAWYVLPVLA